MNVPEAELIELVTAAQEVARLEERLAWHNRGGLPTNTLWELIMSARAHQADVSRRLRADPGAPEGLEVVTCTMCSGHGHTYRRRARRR